MNMIGTCYQNVRICDKTLGIYGTFPLKYNSHGHMQIIYWNLLNYALHKILGHGKYD
jgi:hypothetical protein